MTIEVRQLLIKSQVQLQPGEGSEHAQSQQREQLRQALREDILAECKNWLAQQLLAQRER